MLLGMLWIQRGLQGRWCVTWLPREAVRSVASKGGDTRMEILVDQGGAAMEKIIYLYTHILNLGAKSECGCKMAMWFRVR